MFKVTQKLNFVSVILATVLVAGPAAYPCPAAGVKRLHADATVAASTDKPCCAGCAGDHDDPAREPEPNRRDGPCDCPPSCLAACGCGKLPCPPMDRATGGGSVGPVARVQHVADRQPVDVPSDDLFHPPRV